MDEKTALTQPLLGDQDKKTNSATLQLPTPVQAEVAPPRQKKWKKAVKFGLLALTSVWLLHRFMPNPFAEDFDYSPYKSLLESHYTDALVEADFHSDHSISFGAAPQWITLDKEFFNGTNETEKFSYNLTTSADKIKIFTRGPIVGKIFISSGETAGDEIEVDVSFKKPHHHCHKNKTDVAEHKSEHGHGEHVHHHKHEYGHDAVQEHDDEEYEHRPPLEVTKNHMWSRAWRAPGFQAKEVRKVSEHHHHPHHHRLPPVKVKVVPFYNEDGAITSLGIFAHEEKKGPHGPPHRPSLPPPPPPPPHRLPSGEHPHGPEHDEHRHGDHSEGPHHGDSDSRHPSHQGGPSHHEHHPHRQAHDGHPHGPPHHGRHRHPHKGRPPRAIAHIHVTFPSSAKFNKETPLAIHDFSTSLAGFTHVVHDLTAVFDKFELVTVGRPVFVKAVSATFLKIAAIHGPIFGNFAASKVADLVSVGAPIRANVALHSGPHEKWYNATVFKATAAQSWIKANVSLHSSSSEPGEFGPSYYVKTYSSGSSTWRNHTHSGTFLNFTSQPTNTSLVVESLTRNAPLTVSVPAAFEGWYNLLSPFSKPEVVADLTVEDPTGEGRTRQLTPKKTWTKFKLAGSIKWVKEELLGLGLEKRG
ncbi:hypothetical protein FRB97_006815, partial [Tulasnella sp. 331]